MSERSDPACETAAESNWSEADRLEELERYAILDTPLEPLFDDIVVIAAEVCNAPVAVVNFIAEGRQWFKAETGIGARELPLEVSICRHAILQPGLFQVLDLSRDPRFECNPLVTQAEGLRFYAGALIETPDGLPLGTVCVLDTKPRPEGLTQGQARLLTALGRQVMSELELRRIVVERQSEIERLQAAEQELRISEAVLRGRLNAIPQMVWSTRPDGYHDFYNDRWYEFTGVPAGSTDGAGWSDMFHPEDRERAWAVWRHSLATGEPYEIEYRLRQRSGEYRWVLGRALPVRGESGEILRWMGTCTDIDELKRTADELRRLSTLLQLIGDSTPDLIYAKDRDSRILYANAAAEKVIGRPPEELVGLSDRDFAVDPEHAEAVLASDRRVMETGELLDADETYTLSKGQTVHYRSAKAPLRDAAGEIIGIVGITSDLTARREAEERERLLAREVDHRAKNMLAVVQSVVQLTRADEIGGFKAAVTGRIQSLARTHSLLAASRWDGVELAQLLSDEFEPFTRTGTDRVRITGPRLRLRPAAAQALALVLHELATNAVKYGSLSTQRGRVEVTWKLTGRSKARQLALEWLERGGPRTSQPERQGFGSNLIHMSAERQLGGEVAMDWQPEGLLFRLTLPADQIAETAPQRPETEADQGNAPIPQTVPAGKRVLVVEDEALVAMQVEDAVTRLAGTMISVATSVDEALRLIEAGAIDAALLDVNLAGQRSNEVALALIAAGVPFALCTGYAEDIDLPAFMQGKMRLRKPVEPDLLTNALANLLTGGE